MILTTKITKGTKKIEEIVLKPFVNFVPFVVENSLTKNYLKIRIMRLTLKEG